MLKMKGIIFVCSVIFSQALYAGEIILGAAGGRSNIGVNSGYEPSEDSAGDSQAGTAISGFAGYKFESNIVLMQTIDVYYGDNLLGVDDRVHLNGYSSLVGYSFDVAKHFRIVPMIGVDFWRLETAEGAWSDADKDNSGVYDGSQVVGRIDFDIPFNDLVALNMSYTYGDYEFGDLNAWRVGVKFEF